MSERKERKIKKIVPPPEGSNRPGMVEFEDGLVAKYWGNTRWGTALEVGATAPATVQEKQGQYGLEYILSAFGDAPQKKGPGGGGGRQMSAEERRSIAAQCCIKAAAELFHGTKDMEGAAKAAQGFMKLHDHLVSQGGA